MSMAFENVDYTSLDIPAAPFSDPARIPDFPKNKVPRHIGVIMDGNGRWAKQRGMVRTNGHQAAEPVVFDTIAGAIEAGVRYLSLYTFSTENWKRSPQEVRFLMGFSREIIHRRVEQMDEWGVRVRWSGRRPKLWKSVIDELEAAEERTKNNKVIDVVFCINYGGRAEIADACAAIAQADEGRGPDFCGARIQGIYLEGPFFTMKHVGAQNPAYLIDPSEEVFDQWQEAAGGRIVKSAMAAERDGAAAYAAALNAKGVVTSIGHSDATYDECIAAINAGASCFTHTYNGQRGLHHREPGVVGAAMSTPETYAEIICDGKHVNPAAIKALLQAKGWQHTVLITDCLGCGGMPEGSYTSGGMDVIMKDNLCWLADGKSIAGSVLTLAQGVKNIVDWGIASADIAIRMATEVPARSAHIEDKCGSIMPGRDADFVVFDHELTLVETYVGGQSVGNAFTE